MPEKRTIAIGDIHGCLTSLKTLLAELELRRDDTVVILGDAIDRGPNSRGVLEELLALGEQCQLIPILGNHEQMLLQAVENRLPLQDWLIHGGAETLDSYSQDAALSEVPEEHISFISSWGDYYETTYHFFAHGNYLHSQPLEKQPWDEMRWRSLKYFMPKPHVSGKIAVVGHTSNKLGRTVNMGHLVCIDTYCHGGGWLTALDAERRHLWQSNEEGEVRQCELPPPR